jgi:MoaA/NifB/PqqE/SkfB family radical SAM enzyme
MCLVSYSKKTEYPSKNKTEAFNGDSPKWAYVEITESCSHKCAWCYGEFNKDDKTKHMALSDFKTLLDKLEAIGIYQMSLSGGEPTEHPEFRSFLKLAAERFHVNITTHGEHIDKPLAKFLADNKVDQIHFNYQGSKWHDKIHGIEGSYAAQLNSIKYIKDTDIDFVVGITVAEYNYDDLLDIMTEASDLDASRLRIWESVGHGGKMRGKLKPRDIWTHSTKIAKELGYGFVQSYEPEFEGDVWIPCLAASNFYMYIDVNGYHNFCGAMPSLKGVNLFNESSDTVVNNYKALNETMPKHTCAVRLLNENGM